MPQTKERPAPKEGKITRRKSEFPGTVEIQSGVYVLTAGSSLFLDLCEDEESEQSERPEETESDYEGKS
jgi:hypothetical protein